MIRQLDHIVVLVRDLDVAVNKYSAAGFDVLSGGQHADGATHNALITFVDGTYLELIAFLRDAPEHHWAGHRPRGEALIDFALLPTNITADLSDAINRGLAPVPAVDGGRLRPDGKQLRWQTARFRESALPFLCFDLSPRELRVFGTPVIQPNGVTGIAALIISVEDKQATSLHYQALLGCPPYLEISDSSEFKVGQTILVLRQAAHSSDGTGSRRDGSTRAKMPAFDREPIVVVFRARPGSEVSASSGATTDLPGLRYRVEQEDTLLTD